MNRKSLLTILVGTALVSGLAVSSSFAGPGYGKCGELDNTERQARMAERMDHHLQQMTTVLELTEAQQTQIREVLAKHRAERQEDFEQRCEQREQMRALASPASFDEAAFRAEAEKRASERIDRQVERMKTRQQIFALLTPEQQEKAEVFFQGKGKRGPGHGPGMWH